MSACGGANDDLRAYIDDVKARPGGRIEPLPPIEPAPTFVYEPGARRSPFMPDAPAARRSNDPNAVEGPDPNRPREELEKFPLDTLRMVGTLADRRASFGLVQTTDGLVRRVSRSAITWGRTTAASWPSRILRFNWWRSSPTVSAGTWKDPPRLA